MKARTSGAPTRTPLCVLLVGASMEALATRLGRPPANISLILARTAAEGEAHLPEVDAAVLADRVTPAYLTAPRLRWLHIIGAGVDGFSIPELRDAPFVITHKVQASVIPMAEHIMAQILMIARRGLEYHALQRERRWVSHQSSPTSKLIQLHGKTLGILGLGRAGLATAKRAAAFGMRVIGTKRTRVFRLPHVMSIYAPTELDQCLQASDFVAITAPLTDQTYRMIGERELRAMKRTAYLINVSRGPIIQEDVLVQALREGWIAGASLDTFDHEPLDPDSPLWSLPNAIITPHCGGVGPLLARDSTAELAQNLRRFAAGRPLLHTLNRADIVTASDLTP